MTKKILSALSLVLLLTFGAKANNVTVANVTITGQNTSAGANNAANYTYVQFDLSWSNSWNISAGPQNWDAVWVFVKFEVTGGTGCTAGTTWYHATLSNTSTDHSVVTNNGVTPQIDAVTDGKGVFMHLASNGSGSVNWQSCKLKWNYGTDGILDACQVTVKVFAVEMVYVPTNAFYVGDGDLAGTNGRFCAGTTGSAYQVTAANLPNTLGGGTAASLGNNNAIGMAQADDFNNSTSVAFGTIASWPNGYTKFYSMKYEISQEQYKEFLNTLNGTQQANRTPAISVGAYHNLTAGVTTPQNRNGIKCTVPPSGATAGQYVCDLNNNGVYDEVNGDGRYVACNWLTTADLLAYLDWSCLRPMTELELEKACRGTLLPVVDEYAWGSTTATAATGVTNGGADVELASNAAANVCYNGSFATGPMRCGVFATATSTRAQAGASYYGIMEMTGNVWEQTVTIGNVAGRSFTGANGDGVLAANGAANVGAWPGANGNNTLTTANGASAAGNTGYAGMGFAAGTWNAGTWAQVADRQYRAGWNGLVNRDTRTGGRGVRTAP